MEQPHRSSSPRLLDAISLGVAVAACALSAGCVEPTQSSVIAVPAARPDGDGRQLRLLPPFELAQTIDAVVRITGDVTCTGTLIADDRVLTAHHCVVARDENGRALDYNKRPEQLTIELGGDYLPWGEVTVRSIVAPDCGYTAGDGDIAILVLSRHLIGIPTASIRLDAPPKRREELKVYGFGRCALTSDAIHRVRRTSKPVDMVDDGQFRTDAAICPGDSGGPVYDKRDEIIGVVSASVMDGDPESQGLSLFTRVDVWPQLFSAAHEIANGASANELPPFGDCRLPRQHVKSR